MKNILLFIVDSLNYSCAKSYRPDLMPFLKELEEKGIACDNMYSQAPYTEAAIMNIYCGQDVLSNGGYINRFKDAPLTVFEAMKEKGYVTYFNALQPHCYPSSLRRGVDHIYYNVGFDLGALWSYRLAHFSALKRNNELTEKDVAVVAEIVEDNFIEWILFTDKILTNDPSTEMIIKSTKSYDAAAVKAAVSAQYDRFLEDKGAYVNELLEQGRSHTLFSIPAYVQDNKIQDRARMDEVRQVVMPVLKRIRKMSKKLNFKNTKGVVKGPLRKFGAFLKHPSKVSFKNFLKSGYLSYNALFDSDLYDRAKGDYDRFKFSPSVRVHIDHYVDWAKKAGKDPHFACIHVDDIHNPEVFFTYDSEDVELIKREMADAEQVLDGVPRDFGGSLTHLLSLRYMDGVIRYMYEQLEKEGLAEDTVVAICADHGFSFGGTPLRDSFVVNLYLENYNIPFVVTGADHSPLRVKELRTSKDIAATLCDIADGVVPKDFTGRSVIEPDVYPHVGIEYCGGGCPDLSRRELKMAAFDENWFVGTLARLSDELDDGRITEVYDLKNDPLQLKNLVKKQYDKEAVGSLVKAIRERRDAIRREEEERNK